MGNSLWLTRGALAPLSALAAVTALALPANAQASTPVSGHPAARDGSGNGNGPGLAGEWWLNSLSAQQEWGAAPQEGAEITVAVLSTGVDPNQPDLTGNVSTGPDYTGSGRHQGGQYWGGEGTAVASLIAGHGHGAGGSQGITGIAPKARILSVRTTLDPRDPLLGQPSVEQRLPGAIANGIDYAVSHGAKVIALPVDPATLASAGRAGRSGQAGGSPAERSAIRDAIAHNVVLVAPAGDTGTARATSYPAAYPGVVSAGATDQNGNLAPFSSTASYVSLTAPGKNVTAAEPGSGYTALSSTDASAALTAGIAALVRSRYPQLSASQVSRALKSGSAPVTGQRPGTGAGAVTAVTAVTSAASIVSLIGTPGPKLASQLPLETAIGVGAIIILALIVGGVLRLRRRRADYAPGADYAPEWDGEQIGPPAPGPSPAAPEPSAPQPARRASAASALTRATGVRLPRDGGPVPPAQPGSHRK